LKFSSPAAFNAWKGSLSDKQRAKYANWNVQQDGNKVYVYKDLNGVEGYQADADWLEAVNGKRFVRSRQAIRHGFTTEHSVFKSTKAGPNIGKWRKANHKPTLSANNIVAKVVGAVIRSIRHPDEPKLPVSEYARTTKAIYSPLKKILVGRIKSILRERRDGIEATEAQITGSPEFKLSIMESLNLNKDIIVDVIQRALHGESVVGLLKIANDPAVNRIIDDPAGSAQFIVASTVSIYNLDGDHLLSSLGDLTVPTPAQMHGPAPDDDEDDNVVHIVNDGPQGTVATTGFLDSNANF
jgi:hypothetical protein